MNDSHALEEAKKPRVMGDIPMELIDEVMSTITDPAAMLGPEVSRVNQSSQLVTLFCLQLLEVGVVSLRDSMLCYPGLHSTRWSRCGGQEKLVERWFPWVDITPQRNMLIISHS